MCNSTTVVSVLIFISSEYCCCCASFLLHHFCFSSFNYSSTQSAGQQTCHSELQHCSPANEQSCRLTNFFLKSPTFSRHTSMSHAYFLLLTELWHQQFTKYLFKWASRTTNFARLSSQVNGTSITASTEASRAGWRTSQYLFLSWTEASHVSR